MRHIAFAVEAMFQAALNDAQAAGCQLIDKAHARRCRGIENRIPSAEINVQSIN